MKQPEKDTVLFIKDTVWSDTAVEPYTSPGGAWASLLLCCILIPMSVCT